MNELSQLISAIIAGGAVGGFGLYFAVQYFNQMKSDISEIKRLIENLPCEKHGEDIGYIKGKLNGDSMGK